MYDSRLQAEASRPVPEQKRHVCVLGSLAAARSSPLMLCVLLMADCLELSTQRGSIAGIGKHRCS